MSIDLVDNPFIKEGHILWDRQVDATSILIQRQRVVLADDVGLGKTMSCLSSYSYIRMMRPKSKMVVLCTLKASFKAWKDDINDFLTDTEMCVVADGNEPDLDANIYLTTIGNLSKYLAFFESIKDDLIFVVDEAHRVGNPNTHYYQLLYKYLNEHIPKVIYCWFVTATPITAHLQRFYFFFHMVYPGYLGTLKSFKRKYFIYRFPYPSAPYKELVGYQNMKGLMGMVGFAVIRRESDTKPKLNFHPTQFTLTQMEEELYFQAVDGVMPARSHADIGPRIVDCQYAVDIPPDFECEDRSKFFKLLEICENIQAAGASALIYVPYRLVGKTLHRWFKELGYDNFAYVDGSTPKKYLERVVDWMREEDPSPKFVICTNVLSESNNFPRVQNSIFYSLPFDPLTYIQFIGRIWRDNSIFDNLHVYILMALDTIDHYKDELIAIRAKHISSIGKYDQFRRMNNDVTVDLIHRIKKEHLWRKRPIKGRVTFRFKRRDVYDEDE